MVHRAFRPVVDATRRRLQAAAGHPRFRAILTTVAHEAERALEASSDPFYEGEYFGLGRTAEDHLSGYQRYDRQTSNANAAAFLAWSIFPVHTVLDIGCATGFVVEALREAGMDASGVDISRYAVEHATPGARGHLQRADLRKGLPFAEGEFELVTALETLEHLEPREIPAVLEELARVTSAYVFATIPSFGPNPNGPGGWFQVKVRDDRVSYYESLGPEYEGPVPYGDLYRDARGDPIEGHLTVASFSWWTNQFAAAGLVRCPDAERRLHVDLERFGLTKYWNAYIFRKPPAPEPPEGARTLGARELLLHQWGLPI